MPTTAIPIGPATTITQNIAYALPSKKVRVTSSLAVQTSMDGSTWTALTGAETTGAETGAVFLRCAVGNAIVTCTAAGELGQSWKASSLSIGANPAQSGAIRLSPDDDIVFRHPTIGDAKIIGTDSNNTPTIGSGFLNLPTQVVGGLYFYGKTAFGKLSPAPANEPNLALVYAEDNGSGKVRLVVKFPTGAAIPLATEV